ncbi:MAG: aminotransferase class I/II-fold pyridoxal phosphate-dependent enzyme [Gemmatimonadales bacterium]|nr:aminotransferase class I/II-fold pyridoxal phosphate-dependent enzyme [Gemmatimonadales bacterium]
MIQVSDRVATLPGYPLARIPSLKRRLLDAGVDVIDLGAGDADTPPPRETIDALIGALDQTAMHKYAFQQGLPAFREAAARWMLRRFETVFDPATELLPLIGSKEGLAHLIFAVCNPGDVVILPEPGYQAYLGGAILAGAEPHVVPLRAESGFLLELDDVPAEILARTRLVFLNYPNNPTAAIAPRDYLERTVATCRRHGIVLAYDNAYVDITFDGYVAPSIFEIPGARDVAIEFFSLSKSFQMTGWRLGFAAGNATLIGALSKVKSYVDTGAFLALQRAGAWTLDHAEQLVAPIVAELQHRRDAAVEMLRTAGFEVETPRAAMYLWVPLPRDLPSADFAMRALEEQGVVVLPGSGFGPGGEGYFRIALTAPADRLREAVERLGRTLAACREAGVALSASGGGSA